MRPKKFEFAQPVGKNAPKCCLQSTFLHKGLGTVGAKTAKSISDLSASSRAVDRLKNETSI